MAAGEERGGVPQADPAMQTAAAAQSPAGRSPPGGSPQPYHQATDKVRRGALGLLYCQAAAWQALTSAAGPVTAGTLPPVYVAAPGSAVGMLRRNPRSTVMHASGRNCWCCRCSQPCPPACGLGWAPFDRPRPPALHASMRADS